MQAIGPDAVLDVAITGCGPVGALAASLLARYGLSTPVIEREAALSPLPRAVHLDHGMMLPPDAIAPLVFATGGHRHIGSNGGTIRHVGTAGRVTPFIRSPRATT